MEMCSANFKQQNTGGKSSHTTHAFNITVNHRRRIISTTKGYPGRWNDKTLVTFDDFMRGIQDGEKLAHVDFDLCEPPLLEIKFVCVATKVPGSWLMMVICNGQQLSPLSNLLQLSIKFAGRNGSSHFEKMSNALSES